MARPLRIQFAGEIYPVMARGNGRQRLFHGDDDYQRMVEGLEKTVLQTGWEVFSFVWMPSYVHLSSRTRSQATGRDLAAYLVHRRTTATLREIAAFFRLVGPG